MFGNGTFQRRVLCYRENNDGLCLGLYTDIYYGSEDFIYSIFNKKAFVYYDINNPSSALNLVSRLEANRTMYDKMLNEPILANGNNTIEEYFSFDGSIGNGLLKRRVKDKLNFP